jgi:hypothetical protein
VVGDLVELELLELSELEGSWLRPEMKNPFIGDNGHFGLDRQDDDDEYIAP